MGESSNTQHGVKWVYSQLRIGLCVGLLGYLFHRADKQALSGAIVQAASRWPWMVLGLLFTFLGLLAGAVRWQKVLGVQGLKFTAGKVFHIYFVGQFFNAFMLGACGGDVVRAYSAAQGQKGRRAEAVMTILMDRAIGLFCMIAFACLMISLRLRTFLDNEGPRDTGILMIIFFLAGLGGMVVLFRKNVFEHFSFFRRLEDNTRIGSLIRRGYEAFYLYRQHHHVLFLAVLLSVMSMTCFTLSCWSFGRALEIRVPVIDYFAMFPIISVLMSIPITPGSLGVREGLFVSLFSAVLVDRSHAILLSLMVYAGGVFWSIFGGILYMGLGSKADHMSKDDLDSWTLND